jgi:hypothetical protein
LTDFWLPEVEMLLANEERDSWREKETRALLAQARKVAFLRRRALKRDLAGVSDPRKKRSIQGHNRHVNEVSRRPVSEIKRSRRKAVAFDEVSKTVLLAKRRPSILLDGLFPPRATTWIPMASRLRSRSYKKIAVKNFSLLRNPVATVDLLAEIVRAESTCLEARIDFLDDQCLDIGAWLVFAAMRNDMASIFSGGKISGSVSKVIHALRLQKILRFSLQSFDDAKDDVWAFPVRARRAAGTSTSPTQHLVPQAKERVGGALCEAIDQWLGACVQQQLTLHGRRGVKTIVGECLDNAERHSRREFSNDGDWMITGFMARRTLASGPSFEVQLAFLSVGASISETVKEAHPEILRGMEDYVAQHRQNLANHSRADEHLRTVYALQDNVTCDHEAHLRGGGGTGFRDILCFFGDLAGTDDGSSDPRLSIVSGRTCLHVALDRLPELSPVKSQKFNIWFNPANDPALPPDPEVVKELATDFRGTLITMGFTLDPGYLERSING